MPLPDVILACMMTCTRNGFAYCFTGPHLNFSAALIGGGRCFIILAHVPVRLVFFTFISVAVLGYLKLIFLVFSAIE